MGGAQVLYCSLKYDFNWDKLNEEQRILFLETWPFAAKHHNKEKNTLDQWSIGDQRLGIEEVYKLQAAGIPGIDIEGVDGTMLTKMQDRGDRTNLTGIDLMEAKTVQIAVSDVGLLLLDEVDWMEDACTQELQQRLDEGWRILAVCPPNAQRRPDYILGRRKVRPE